MSVCDTYSVSHVTDVKLSLKAGFYLLVFDSSGFKIEKFFRNRRLSFFLVFMLTLGIFFISVNSWTQRIQRTNIRQILTSRIWINIRIKQYVPVTSFEEDKSEQFLTLRSTPKF